MFVAWRETCEHWISHLSSCLRALDLTSKLCVAVVLHADDPVLLSSSQGAAQDALRCMARWAYVHKAAFHAGPSKSVVLVIEGAPQPVLFQLVIGSHTTRLTVKHRHRYLGLLWPASLCFLQTVLQHISIADGIVVQIVSLIEAGLPLPFGLLLFESKVDGFLRFGRWLLAADMQSLHVYESAFDRWTKQLLGLQPWRNAAVASMECGWNYSGDRRAVIDIALRRARLWLLPDSDLYSALFRRCHHGHTQGSWAQKSLDILRLYSVPDLPELGLPLMPLSRYKAVVCETLCAASADMWWSGCESHVLPLPYKGIRADKQLVPSVLLQPGVSWDALVGIRNLIKLRAGALDLAHCAGRRKKCQREILYLLWEENPLWLFALPWRMYHQCL